MIVTRGVFFKMGGYDERYGLLGNYDVELRERLKFHRYEMRPFPYDIVKPRHLRPSVWNKKGSTGCRSSLPSPTLGTGLFR